jgi:hypothetical protein
MRKLRTKIKISIDSPEIITEFPNSHPRGFLKEFKKRRTTIVESYLKLPIALIRQVIMNGFMLLAG